MQIGRFQHSGDTYGDYLVFFGGEASNGTILDDLWMFNIKLKAWIQPSNHDVNKPIGVVGHTVNIVEDKLYLFGGEFLVLGFLCCIQFIVINDRNCVQSAYQDLIKALSCCCEYPISDHISTRRQCNSTTDL